MSDAIPEQNAFEAGQYVAMQEVKEVLLQVRNSNHCSYEQSETCNIIAKALGIELKGSKRGLTHPQ